MRILILCDRVPPDNAGGAEKVAWAAARGLRESGHEVFAAAATSGAPFEDVRDGIPVSHLHVNFPERWHAYLSLWNPQVSGPLTALIQRVRPDVVSGWVIQNALTFASLSTAHAAGVATVFNSQDVMPVSYTRLTHYVDPTRCVTPQQAYKLPPLHGLRVMRLRYNPLRMLLIRRILTRHVDVCVAGSDVHRQALAANGLPDFRVVRASVEPHDFDVRPETIAALRAELGLTGRKVILFAGRLTRDKGSAQMLAALQALVEQVPDVLLLTLTRATPEQQGLDAPEYAALRDHVTSGGWLTGERLAAAYQLADVVAVPSICMDTFPTVNLEAMAARKPVIATCYGGSREAVQDGVTGFIVNPFDTAAFCDRLQRVLTDPALARQLGAAGHERLLAEFTPQRHVRELEAVYADAITRRRGR
jgi:glycosyltransferase involved in cell wall biosynthesis